MSLLKRLQVVKIGCTCIPKLDQISHRLLNIKYKKNSFLYRHIDYVHVK